METRRLHFIDWLRVLAVLLLFPFHAGRVFNDGEPFYVKGSELSTAVSHVLGFIDQWHMPLLFALAGASTCLALRKRTTARYATERVRRLLVPLLFGVLVLIPPQTWYGGRFNSGYEGSYLHYLTSGDFLEMNIRDGGDYYGGFGIGHLWFILFLLLISLLVLPLWARRPRRRALVGWGARMLCHPAAWVGAGFLVMLVEALPALGGKNVFYYSVFFVLGYVAMSGERFMEVADRLGPAALVTGVAIAVWWSAAWRWRDGLADPSVALAAVNLTGMTSRWLIIVGLLGLGRRYLDRDSATLGYLAEGSYPVYILHQTVIVVLAFSLVELPAAWPVQWLVLLIGSVAITFAGYEAVRRVGWLRFLFGMRPRVATTPAPPVEPVLPEKVGAARG